MLTDIYIRDFAIIECLELSLNCGMTVLTGETGAGKSILVDALNLALGDRADSSTVRHGCERAEIGAGFDISGIVAARQWLEEHEIEAEDECLLRRSVTREGRSKGYINGSPVPLQSLQELGEMLVDIHGQHEHQSLLKSDAQRQMLDDYAGHAQLAGDVATAYQHWKSACRELLALERAAAERDARLELLSYQVGELQVLNLGESEVDEINAEHARLANASRLLEVGQSALESIYENEEGSIYRLLTATVKELRQLEHLDKRLSVPGELLENAAIQIREAAGELHHYLDSLPLDPQDLERVEQRLASAHQLARKHRVAPQELPALLTSLKQALAELQGAGLRLDQLQSEIRTLESAYLGLAQKLSAGRAQAARELGERVSTAMQQLAIASGRFEIALERLPSEHFSATGVERIEFLVSANPGQPLKPLNKVASGGELSRISLAIQVIMAHSGRVPTLIFDEVDVGIGGGVAEIVGKQLRTLSQNRQVLCVTHLPQVAAQGDHHLQVNKESSRDGSLIAIRKLSRRERHKEIARMLGGVRITEQTLAHAAEMVENAQGHKLERVRE